MRGLTRFLSGILTLLFVMMIMIAWFHEAVDAPGPLKQTKAIVIPTGDTTRMIAERLEQQGAISSQTVFLAHVMSQDAIARVAGRPSRHMKAGEYEIEAASSVRAITNKLTEGRSLLYSVTMPEGLTSHEIVRRLNADTNLSGEITIVPSEGSLLPETFRVPRNTERNQVLTLLRQEQNKFLSKVWETRKPDLPIRTKEEALVLASIVEKETGPRDDPATIAGVFINRLRKGMRLQSDPTILYGKHGPTVDWGDKIFRSDINRKTAYNTYQIDGLPPTPICNPGRKSIAAVLNPAETNYLFFVADGRGGHIFSETLQEHERAVRDWRKIEREIRKKEAVDEKLAQSEASTQAPTLLNRKSTNSTAANTSAGAVVPLPVQRPLP